MKERKVSDPRFELGAQSMVTNHTDQTEIGVTIDLLTSMTQQAHLMSVKDKVQQLLLLAKTLYILDRQLKRFDCGAK